MTSFSIQSPRSIHFMTTEGRVAGDKNKNNSRMISPILHQLFQTWLSDIIIWFKKGFPGGSEGKASAYNAGDLGSIPGSGRSPGEGTGTPLQYPCWKIPWTEKPGRLQSMGLQRVRHNWATSLHFQVSFGLPGGSDGKASAHNLGDPGSIPGLRRFPGEENGNPL